MQNYFSNQNLDLKEQLTEIKYHYKVTMHAQNSYLGYLGGTSFQEVNRLFALSYEDNAHRTNSKLYFLWTIKVKDYDVLIDQKKFFGQSVNNDLGTHDNI